MARNQPRCRIYSCSRPLRCGLRVFITAISTSSRYLCTYVKMGLSRRSSIHIVDHFASATTSLSLFDSAAQEMQTARFSVGAKFLRNLGWVISGSQVLHTDWA